jgi:thiamine biosynthesis lipoprotein
MAEPPRDLTDHDLSGRYRQHVMGTVVSFDLHDPVPADALAEVRRWLHHVDRVFSTYRRDSDISRLDRAVCRIEDCDPDVARVLEMCADAASATDGYFTTMPAGRLDPSGLVKGWAVEKASDMLCAAGSQRHVVNGGGDIQSVGTAADGQPWRVGISDPFDRDSLLCVVDLAGGAVATSGTAERGSHVINPRTGRPAEELASVTVVCPRLTDADVIATAAVARGTSALTWLETVPDAAAIVVDADGRTHRTSNWTEAVAARG